MASLQRAATSGSSNPRSSGGIPALQLRVAVSSGEPLPLLLLGQLQQLLPQGCRIWNLYGSTEVAADCTAFACTTWRPQAGQQAEKQVPVGQPISSTLLAVLAPAGPEQAAASAATHAAAACQRAVLPLGEMGEVAVAGAGLAAGYLCQQQAAASAAQQQRFVQLPTSQLEQAQLAGASVAVAADLPAAFWREESTRLFLTGDMGWLDASGCLHLAGRRDLQIKIAGRGDARVACMLCMLRCYTLQRCIDEVLFWIGAAVLCRGAGGFVGSRGSAESAPGSGRRGCQAVPVASWARAGSLCAASHKCQRQQHQRQPAGVVPGAAVGSSSAAASACPAAAAKVGGRQGAALPAAAAFRISRDGSRGHFRQRP